MASEVEARGYISKYVLGQIDLSEFEEQWFLDAIWAAPSDDEFLPLILIEIGDYRRGNKSEEELKSALHSLIQNQTVRWTLRRKAWRVHD